jgi:alpha-glucosidase
MTAGEQTLIRFTRSGSYPTDAETVLLDVLHREKAPFTVKLDEKELPHYLYRKKFEEAEEGWYYSQTKKSVLIRYRNPKEDYTVTVSFAQFDLIGM